jgi:DNA-binding XRE family transcriptional regulator
MDKNEFITIRKRLRKTQKELSALLGVSLKAISSYEQGWRNIPVHVERQLLLLLSQKNNAGQQLCWDIRQCSDEVKKSCPAWEFNAGHLCWFISGTICNSDTRKSWEDKLRVCRTCPVFTSQMQF